MGFAIGKRVQGSGFRVQGCGGGFAANIYGAMPEGSWVAVFPYRHLERSREIFLADREMVYMRKSAAPPQQGVISLSLHAC